MQSHELRLVLEAVGGNAESFSALTALHGPAVIGLAYSLTGDLEAARDISQETFLRAYASLQTLHRPERFGSWLRQIAANLARTHLRQSGRSLLLPPDQMPEQEVSSVDQTVETNLTRQELMALLQAIPEGPRTALVLHYVAGLSPADAATRLGISRAAFDTRLSRGREALRRELTLLMDEALQETREQVTGYLAGLSDRVRSALGAEPRERAAAARELALLAARANLPRLVRDLKNPDETIRKNTAALLGDTLDRRVAPDLLQALQREAEPSVLAELCRALARIGVAEAVPHLQKLIRNTADMTVHKAAADAVKALQTVEGTPPEADVPVDIDDLKEAGIEGLLLDLLKDDAAAVRVHAADGLGRVESVKAMAPLAALVRQDPQDYVRRAAADALGAILWPGRTSRDRVTPAQRTKAVHALAEALGDTAMAVQAEAAWSLALITPPGDETLRGLVMDRFYVVAETAVERPGPWWVSFPAMLGALGTAADRVRVAQFLLRPDIRWKGPFTEALCQMAQPGEYDANLLIMEAVQKQADPRCNHKLLKALGATLDPDAVPLLQACAGPSPPDPRLGTPQVRTEAAKALAAYPDGRELLRHALLDWVMAPKQDDTAIAALAGALESVATAEDAPVLEELAGKVSPRAQISLRASARRLSLAER